MRRCSAWAAVGAAVLLLGAAPAGAAAPGLTVSDAIMVAARISDALGTAAECGGRWGFEAAVDNPRIINGLGLWLRTKAQFETGYAALIGAMDEAAMRFVRGTPRLCDGAITRLNAAISALHLGSVEPLRGATP